MPPLLVLMLLGLGSVLSAHAADVVEATITWTMPTVDCYNEPFAQSDLKGYRLYVAESPIPDNWTDTPCGKVTDVVGAIRLLDESVLTPTTTSVEVTYTPQTRKGTLYLRMTVVGTNGMESGLGDQATIPFKFTGRPKPLQILVAP